MDESMKSIGLAMIIRDCEDTLETCLKSTVGLFDQVVLVDTGSKDNTIKIAQQYGDVYHFDWCYDFSAARNYSFDQLKTDWAFWLDSDDLLVGQENFETILDKAEQRNVDGVLLEYYYALDAVGEQLLYTLEPQLLARSIPVRQVQQHLAARCITTQYRERIVKHDPTWRWAYPIHEALPMAYRQAAKSDDMKIIHRRHLQKNPDRGKRNLEILERVPLERRDERIMFYFGLEYATAGRNDEATKSFERYLDLSSVPDEKYLALHYLGDLYRSKNDLETSDTYNLRAIALRPTWKDAYAGLLHTAVQRQDWERALYYGAMTQKSEDPDTPMARNVLHSKVGWIGDYVRALVETGQLEEARGMTMESLAVVPEDDAHRHNLDVLSIKMNLNTAVEHIANTLEFFLRHDDAETAAVLVARLVPDFQKHPRIKEIAAKFGPLCKVAASGGIIADQFKRPPGVDPDADEWWEDYRTQHLRDALAKRPYIRRVIQVGGPLAMNKAYSEMGITAIRAEHTSQITGQYDAAVVWSALERVKNPEMVMASVRAATAPGGEVFIYVPNGPASKGLAPPSASTARLRAYTMDSLRQVAGTVKMPTIIPGWSAEAGDLALNFQVGFPQARRKSIAIVCPGAPEPWGPASLGVGIGGSEEAVVRLSRAFARRGHTVGVYGSGWVGNDPEAETVYYRDMGAYIPSDVLIGWRHPEIFIDQLRPFEAEWRALWLHDSISKERVARAIPFIDQVWCISDYHAHLYDGLPKIYRGRNGVDPLDMPQIGEGARNPHKIVYVSTPFRGLDTLLEMWPAIKAKVPDAELHAYYGWESADRMGVTSTPEGKAFKDRVVELAKQEGVVWHGRIGQSELYREVMSAGVWAYPTRWNEEHCISAYIAQACGAWPVVFPLGALPQSVVWGAKTDVSGFVPMVVEACETEKGRQEMMEWTRKYTSWDDVAGLWEMLWTGRPA